MCSEYHKMNFGGEHFFWDQQAKRTPRDLVSAMIGRFETKSCGSFWPSDPKFFFGLELILDLFEPFLTNNFLVSETKSLGVILACWSQKNFSPPKFILWYSEHI